MHTREQVIEGLNELSAVYHSNQILSPKDFVNQHDMEIIDSAIAMLISQGQQDFSDKFIGLSEQAFFKKQEPRVMTLEEIKALPDETDVWLEEFTTIVIAATICNKPTMAEYFEKRCLEPFNAVTMFYGINNADYDAAFYNSDYGKEWRCWTSRPTDAQREATPWQG